MMGIDYIDRGAMERQKQDLHARLGLMVAEMFGREAAAGVIRLRGQ